MSDFDWKRKERLQEQLKFFGAKKTRFISCYAKKPRVRVLTKIAESNYSLCPDCNGSGIWAKSKCVGDCVKCGGTGRMNNNTNQLQGLANMQVSLSMATGLQNARMGALQGLASSQSQIAQAQVLAMQETARQQAIYDLNRGASLACLVGSAHAAGVLGVSL